MKPALKITQAKAELKPLKEQLDQLWEQYTEALITNNDPDLIQCMFLKLQELPSQHQSIINAIKND